MRILSIAIFLIFCACTTATKNQKSGINWYNGNMDSALALAKKENKPLFVYWGAVWCPPCNVIKANLFPDPEVIEASKLYISVYLDGDTEEAQAWGDKLNASGYPTLMILSPEGKEAVRLSSQLTPTQFSDALKAVHSNLDPIGKTIKVALAGSTDRKIWDRLTTYSWGLHPKSKNFDKPATLKKLWMACPKNFKEHKTTLMFSYINSADLKKISKLEKTAIAKNLRQILNTPSELDNYISNFAYMSAEYTSAFIEKKNHQQWISKYLTAMNESRARLSGAHRKLRTYYPAIDLAAKFPKLTPAINKNELKANLLSYTSEITDDKTRTYLTSTISYMLTELGLYDDSEKLLLEQMKKSNSPYYMMSGLAYNDKKRDRKKSASLWYKKAYSASEGPATRLQWGSAYVMYKMESNIYSKNEVVGAVKDFYQANLSQPDSFYGRNKARLNRLSKKLKEWGKKQKQSLKPVAQLKGQICVGEKSSNYIDACNKYFGNF